MQGFLGLIRGKSVRLHETESSDRSNFAATTALTAENSSHPLIKCSDGVVNSVDPENLVDRISSLPDSILCYILSFLPTHEAVATSILSRRWKFLWTEVPSLDFDDCEEPFLPPYQESVDGDIYEGSVNSELYRELVSRERVVKFVNMVLLLNKVQCLNKFCLWWSNCPNAFYTSTWIRTAIARNVRILKIYVFLEFGTIHLPSSIFTCETLEFLELHGKMVIKVPSFVRLPRLVTLDLMGLDDRSHESITEIVSGCAVLESLFIKRDPCSNVELIKFSSPTLKTLKLEFGAGRGLDDNRHHKLEINAPALERLHLMDRVTEQFTVQSGKALSKAEVDIVLNDPPEIDYCNSVVELFLVLQHVVLLTLSRCTMEVLSRATAHFSPKFDRLTTLVVEAGCCKWNFLPVLLERSVNLEVLNISKSSCHEFVLGPHRVCWRNPDRVPRCLLTSLAKISVKGLSGLEDELAMISYFLKHGRVLQRVELHSRIYPEVKERFQLLQKISLLPRKSDTCEVAFD